MDANAAPLSELVVEFLVERLRIPREQLRPDSRLNQDLGVDGDDAYGLLIAFSEKFQVGPKGLTYLEHFGPEASLNPVTSWFPKSKIPITVDDLVQSAVSRKWQIRAKSQAPTSR